MTTEQACKKSLAALDAREEAMIALHEAHAALYATDDDEEDANKEAFRARDHALNVLMAAHFAWLVAEREILELAWKAGESKRAAKVTTT